MSSKQSPKLTIEKLRQYHGFENISDNEAHEAIIAIEKCARLFFELYVANKKGKENEKQSS